jgi:chaperonin GroEL (HSP60 family)
MRIGAGAFEVAAAHHLRTVTKKLVQGRAKLGIEAYAEALMGFPKILAENSGHDAQVRVVCVCRKFRWGKAAGEGKEKLDGNVGEGVGLIYRGSAESDEGKVI